MNEQKILDIRLMNQFLSRGINVVERPVFKEIKKSAKGGMIVVLKGLRRTGKSTLMKYYLLSKKKNAFYYSFDEEDYPDRKDLNDIIIYALSMNKKIIGLDEVQKVKGWAGTIKKYYDHAGVQFILSGSSSLDVTAGSESLAGRRIDIKLNPLTFNEYTLFRKFPYLNEYLETGFPEMLVKDVDVRSYLLSIINKVVNKDIPKMFNVKKPQLFDDMIKILAERNTQQIDYRDIASDLEVSKE
ncbi:ATP-binding protein, partial [Candidatus Micrarchaeota archaeon]|nr:ATP-binding protein [Candidatus Micrarchaeota archaeon]